MVDCCCLHLPKQLLYRRTSIVIFLYLFQVALFFFSGYSVVEAFVFLKCREAENTKVFRFVMSILNFY